VVEWILKMTEKP